MSNAVDSLSKTWHLPEGSTDHGFETSVLIQKALHPSRGSFCLIWEIRNKKERGNRYTT